MAKETKIDNKLTVGDQVMLGFWIACGITIFSVLAGVVCFVGLTLLGAML